MHAGSAMLYYGSATQHVGGAHAPTMSLVDVVAYSAGTLVAGVLTGVASAVVRVPVSVIKSRIQLGLPSGGRGASPAPNPLPRPSNL